jgi:hypothetical protein
MRNIIIFLIMTTIAISILTSESYADNLRILPRWGVAWVAPQITGSWIMLRYKHDWTKETAPTGKVFFELPAGVKCVSAIGMQFEETPTLSG